MRSCIFVIGTRAQLVKVAPVLQRAVAAGLPHTVWLAGQHTQSIGNLIEDFGLKSPVVAFPLGRENSSIVKLAGWMPKATLACATFIRRERQATGKSPLVVVHGDTASTLVGALAGRIAGGEVAHLESGLSSGALLDPFPEEMIRRLTFLLAHNALCPNEDACARMRRYRNCRVINTEENTLLDCVRYSLETSETGAPTIPGCHFVASIHRFQNIYRHSHLAQIVSELISVSSLGEVYFVLHPPTQARLKKTALLPELKGAKNIKLLQRLPFSQFLALLASARGVFSDGGSNQEELSYLGVPTVLFRSRSERPDGLRENIVLRADIRSSLTEYVASGQLDMLRRPSKVTSEKEPSNIAIGALLQWAKDY